MITEIHKMENYSLTAIDYQIRTRMYEGRKQIIVPVVMMVEGVHAGSHGPLLHMAEDLGKFPASWNGIPVMIGHPSIDGYNVSANSPDVLEQSVGRVFNTHMDDKKLKAEVWLDEQRIIAISPTALSYIQNGRQLEVSIGVFTDEESSPGTYTNDKGEEEQYSAIARNHRPDHLALLPSEKGACGWNDGCGIRANSLETNKEVNVDENMKNQNVTALRQMAQEDFLQSITDNKQGYQELMGKISEKLYSKDSEEEYYMLEEVYDDSMIYRKRCSGNSNNESGWYKQTYQINADDSIEFVGEPQRVRRDVNYVQVNKMQRTVFNTNKKGELKMAENNKPCCLEKVVELLNNKLINLTEEDREWLLELGPEKLERITPKAPVVAEPVQVNMAEYIKKDSISTFEEVLAIAPDAVKEQMQAGLILHQAHRTALIESVLANSEKDAWTEDELKEQSTVMLEKLNKQFKPAVNYVGQGAGADLSVNADENKEILLPINSTY